MSPLLFRSNVTKSEGLQSREECSVRQPLLDSVSSEGNRTTSNSELTRSGKRKNKKSQLKEGSHKVTFTVTISKAIPKGQ